ncbi:MAG TPA: SRPBCC domain-containing protein [Dehalococcoidia bacterium]|nr:SRPBCC domain-containing protein [Dehalococcoidia bacterium]
MTNPTTGLKITTPTDLEIVMTRDFQAPRQLVFDAWTNCEHLKRWWGPSTWSLPVCEIDFRVGGKWRFLMKKGEQGEEMGMEEMGMYGEYREIAAPGRLVSTENFDGEWFEPMGGGTVQTMVLEERDGVTTMTVTSAYKSKEARDGVLQFPMEEGAEESFQRLDALLAALAQ